MSARSVFEDVGGTADDVAKAQATAKGPGPARKGIFVWLMILAALVAIMVLVGGATRLTDSGLSITEWAPVMGAMPPLSTADWEAAFAAYQETTEFKQQNNWMTLSDFKPIFWWEWGHRFLGRFIGLVWLVGFLFFLFTRKIPDGWTGRLILPGILGGLQGALGWWMVASGLVGRLDVAPYRLAAHLGLAFIIFAVVIWLALRVRKDSVQVLQARRQRDTGLMRWVNLLGILVFLQILLGALVAGLDAGQAYIDWPLMSGDFFPGAAFDLSPAWQNFFENPALTQFNHRIAAYFVIVATLFFWWRTRKSGHAKIKAWGGRVLMVVLAQAVLGIITLVHAAPVGLALIHQGLALVLTGALVHARFEIAYPSEQKITA
ncbi:MAG: COX15/CtaA family protein [Pseudomonadota bacterium]